MSTHPADDDGHGVSVLDTSAGQPAGVSDAPMDDNHPPAVPRRPPASTRRRNHFGKSVKSLGKVSPRHQRETPVVADTFVELEVDLEDEDGADDEVTVDGRFRHPSKPLAPVTRYRPGHRQIPDARARTSPDGSWWMRPDADFTREAERMRLDPKQPKVPGENHILCMIF